MELSSPSMAPTRRLAAIMFTDMVGYTALTRADEARAMDLRELHSRLLRPIFAKHQGKEVKTMGDSFLVEFESALEATECAVEIQQFLHDYNLSSAEEGRIRLRIGIHLGDVLHDRNDVFGDAVNIAARIEPLAEPEGVCLSEQVCAQVRNKMRFPIVTLGKRELKNVGLPVEVFRIELPWTKETRSASGSDRLRIAVLPFRNISPNPGDEYLADGMTEELISTLSRIGGLRVISRSSVMRYKGTGKSIPEIGAELRAGAVLEGSVRIAADALRVTAQLVDAGTDEYLWSRDFDKRLENVFAIQTEIARSVAEALRVHLLASERGDLERPATAKVDAYAMYLKGRHSWNERTRSGNERAITYFEKAIAIDPSFALAHAGLADCHLIAGDYGWGSPNETYPLAIQHARRGIDLDPRLAESHATLALVYTNHSWKWREAEEEFRRAIVLKPSYATAHQWFGVHFLIQFPKRREEAYTHIQTAHELDPLSRVIDLDLGIALFALGRGEEGARQLRRVVDTNPDYAAARLWLGLVLYDRSHRDLALRELRQAVALSENEPEYLAELGYVLAREGARDEALAILYRLGELSKGTYVSKVAFAKLEFGLGQSAEAFDHLGEAIRERAHDVLDFNWLPLYTAVRGDPRWAAFLKEIEFPGS